jgi:ABC-type transporter Mla subunit MlaD
MTTDAKLEGLRRFTAELAEHVRLIGDAVDRQQVRYIDGLKTLSSEVADLKRDHAKLTAELKRRNDQLDDLLRDQRDGDWWKNGGENPYA